MATAMGGRGGTPSSAAISSERRSSGHSPMNLVVTCKLAGAAPSDLGGRTKLVEEALETADELGWEIESDEQAHSAFIVQW